MDYDKIIDKINKYYYILCHEDDCKIISVSDYKTEAKDIVKKKLSSKWDDLVGTTIYSVTFRKSVKGKWEPEKQVLLSGPIFMEISEYKIKKNNKLKRFSSGINSNVFFSDHYLRKNKKIKVDDVKLVLKFKNRELKKGLMENNVI